MFSPQFVTSVNVVESYVDIIDGQRLIDYGFEFFAALGGLRIDGIDYLLAGFVVLCLCNVSGYGKFIQRDKLRRRSILLIFLIAGFNQILDEFPADKGQVVISD